MESDEGFRSRGRWARAASLKRSGGCSWGHFPGGSQKHVLLNEPIRYKEGREEGRNERREGRRKGKMEGGRERGEEGRKEEGREEEREGKESLN